VTTPTQGWLDAQWLQTNSGGRFYPFNPRVEDVNIADIAHALSLLCRYGGHVDRFYSVAEHCVLMADWVLHETGDRQLAPSTSICRSGLASGGPSDLHP
jgi:hypothetical protein